MREPSIIQYIRGEDGRFVGAMVAIKNGIGWSAVHPLDRGKRFDKQLALRIAFGRARAGSTSAEVPSYALAQMENFRERASRYFRRTF